jgi:hypothetical protein
MTADNIFNKIGLLIMAAKDKGFGLREGYTFRKCVLHRLAQTNQDKAAADSRDKSL